MPRIVLNALFAMIMFVMPVGAAAGPQEQVVLLHGITRSDNDMKSMEAFLAAKGFAVINLDYPSTRHSIEQLAAGIASRLQNEIDPSVPVHFVGHSMGGLVIRAVLNRYRPDNLGRVVQIGTPNHGSEVADFLKNDWLYRLFFGPAGQQLVTQDAGLGDLLGEVDYELGVIAGDLSIDPVSSSIIPGPDDGKVSVESTKIQGMRDHDVVPVIHSLLTRSPMVQRRVLRFLRYGGFG